MKCKKDFPYQLTAAITITPDCCISRATWSSFSERSVLNSASQYWLLRGDRSSTWPSLLHHTFFHAFLLNLLRKSWHLFFLFSLYVSFRTCARTRLKHFNFCHLAILCTVLRVILYLSRHFTQAFVLATEILSYWRCFCTSFPTTGLPEPSILTRRPVSLKFLVFINWRLSTLSNNFGNSLCISSTSWQMKQPWQSETNQLKRRAFVWDSAFSKQFFLIHRKLFLIKNIFF